MDVLEYVNHDLSVNDYLEITRYELMIFSLAR
jgi:hypothetical protein